MDELMKAMQRIEATRRTNTPWTPDKPYPQPYYAFNGSDWETRQPGAAAEPREEEDSGHGLSRLALFSWNIDFMLPHAEQRMRAALAHLEALVLPLLSASSSSSSSSEGAAVVIFLQECVSSDLGQIARTPWVRDRFYAADAAPGASWASGHYGTTALVDRRLPVSALFRAHYAATRMERDALFVDVAMDSISSSSSSNSEDAKKEKKKIIRLCNTHLESLALDPPLRPKQVRLFASYMHDAPTTTTTSNDGSTTTTTTTTTTTAAAGNSGTLPPPPHGAVAAGDFNAIQDFDRQLHADNGLRDAFLELGGREDTPEAFTWGQQAATGLRKLYGCSRMDKVFFCGGLKLLRFERFGAGVQLEGEGYAGEFAALDLEKPWVTDHLGVRAEFDVVD